MLTPLELLLLTGLVCLVCLGVLGSLARSGVPGVKQILAANLLTLAALLVFYVLMGFWPSRPLLMGGNLLYVLGTCAYYLGLCRFLARRPPWTFLAVAVVAATVANGLFMFVWPSANVRIVAASGVHILLYAGVAGMLWRAIPDGARTRYGHYFTLVAALVATIGHAIRTAIYAIGIERMSSLAEPMPWNLAFLIIGVFVMPAMLLGFILMVQSQLLDERQREADTDSLTGLLTRKAWRREVLPLCPVAGGSVAILLVDIDHFKHINDQHGHAAGDCVLQHFAQHLRLAAGERRLASRWGGEEFALALPDVTAEQAFQTGEGLRRALSASPCQYEGQALACTFSGGQVQWREGESLDHALLRADRALYAAKMQGRDRLQQAERMQAQVA